MTAPGPPRALDPGLDEAPAASAEALDDRVASSVLGQVVARGAHLLLNVVSSLAIIRYMSPAAYGDYVLVVTLVTLLGLFSDFGLNKLATRDVAVDHDREGAVIGTVAATRLVLAVVAALVVQVALLALGRPDAVRLAAAVASLLLVAEALQALFVAFHVRMRQQYEAYALLAGEAVETTLVLWLVTHDGTLLELLAAPVLGGGVAVVLAGVVTRRGYRLRPVVALALVRPLLRCAAPIAAAGVVGVFMLKFDSVMLSALRSPRDVGLYGAAFQPVEYLLVAGVVLVTVGLPLLSRAFEEDRARFSRLYGRGLAATVAATLPVAAVLALVAEPLTTLVYGRDFAEAATPLAILATALPFMLVSAWQALALLAAGRQRLTVVYNLVALGVSVVLNLVLIPPLGTAGAALATLGTVALAVVLAGVCVARTTGARLDRAALTPIAVAAAAALVVVRAAAWGGLGAVSSALLATVVYGGALHATGAYRLDGLVRLRRPAAPDTLERSQT